MNSVAMSANFEAQKNRQAFSYTALICALFLAIAILYTWPLQTPPSQVVQDLIEINLGNEKEGMGDVQPLVKGDPAPEERNIPMPAKSSAMNEPSKNIEADDNNDPESAPVTKPVKPQPEAKTVAHETTTKPVKIPSTNPVVNPNPAPSKPKIPLYKGGNGNGGNGADQDNGYRNQGYKGGNGDAGSPDGKPDSYGNTPGGKTGGGPRVTSGDRKIIRYYAFTGDLPAAVINAVVKVSPEGRGRFSAFGKPSTTTSQAYASAINEYLANVTFDKKDHESSVIVTFNFKSTE